MTATMNIDNALRMLYNNDVIDGAYRLLGPSVAEFVVVPSIIWFMFALVAYAMAYSKYAGITDSMVIIGILQCATQKMPNARITPFVITSSVRGGGESLGLICGADERSDDSAYITDDDDDDDDEDDDGNSSDVSVTFY